MIHFGLRKKKPFYQIDEIRLFFDADSDLEVYPGHASGQFVYLVVDWRKVELEKLSTAFKFYFEEPEEDHYRIILPLGSEIIRRIDIVVQYPHLIHIFINSGEHAFDYAHQGNLELPVGTFHILYNFENRLAL